MSDAYAFWRAQLDGKTPETTPGTPHAGFYQNIFRKSEPNPHSGVGKPRRKIRHIPQVLAIWCADDWLCRIDSPDGVGLIEGLERVDNIFAVVARNAITFARYQELVLEYENARAV